MNDRIGFVTGTVAKDFLKFFSPIKLIWGADLEVKEFIFFQ